MRKIVIATKNQGKLKEFKSLFSEKKYSILGLEDIHYDKNIIEDGQSFKENAMIKAKQVGEELGMITISDDSGLEVFSLNNEPGIYSARYAGIHDDNANNQLLLERIKDKKDKGCRYVCAIAIYFPHKEMKVVEEYCYGEITLKAKGQNGFGYDPYFLLPEYQKTMAEISLYEKNKISHRAKALRKLQEVLNEDFTD